MSFRCGIETQPQRPSPTDHVTVDIGLAGIGNETVEVSAQVAPETSEHQLLQQEQRMAAGTACHLRAELKPRKMGVYTVIVTYVDVRR